MSHDDHQPYVMAFPPYGDLDQLREYLSTEFKRIEIAFNGVDLDVEPRWDSIPINLTFSAVSGAGNTPSYSVLINDGASSVGVIVPWFSAAANQSLFFVEPLPHTWKEGSTLVPYLNFCHLTATAGATFIMGLEYTMSGKSGTVGVTKEILCTSTCNGILQQGECGFPISATANTIHSIILGRFFRSTTDDYNSRVAILGAGVHFQKDTHGSETKEVK